MQRPSGAHSGRAAVLHGQLPRAAAGLGAPGQDPRGEEQGQPPSTAWPGLPAPPTPPGHVPLSLPSPTPGGRGTRVKPWRTPGQRPQVGQTLPPECRLNEGTLPDAQPTTAQRAQCSTSHAPKATAAPHALQGC